MNGYTSNIEREALENEDFRRVLYTTANIQLVVMSIPAGGEIGEEIERLVTKAREEGLESLSPSERIFLSNFVSAEG